MTTAIPFAGLAPDPRPLRGYGELARFDALAALDVCQQLRNFSTKENLSSQVVANHLLDAINAFEHDGRPACVLLRLFVTRKLHTLSEDLQAVVHASSPALARDADPLCLSLVGSRGIEPAWNAAEQSAKHRALLLDDTRAPMVSELIQQLRVTDRVPPPVSTLYVPEADESTSIADKSFVRAYGVRSVFGFAAPAWPGETLVFLAFSRAFLEQATVRAFAPIGVYMKTSWVATREARVTIGSSIEQVRARISDELVAFRETELRDTLLELRERFEAARAEATQLAEASSHSLERHNNELRRTQRAMLNVIDDLRVARNSLQSQVEARTRELASANKQLEVRNRELEEFVYIASHDLQEPLRTVSGYLQMVQRRYAQKLDSEADEFIGFAVQGAQRMQSLIESLLLYSRVARADAAFQLTPLEQPLRTALQNLALRIEETHARIQHEELPSVHADPVQMVQLFQNLLSNAIKFAGSATPTVRITARQQDGFHVIDVRDEGIGFNPKFKDRIFKVFRRLSRDTEGTGIGLAVCKKIAARHGGHIEAQSSPGQGATFSIYFPLDSSQV
jgi:signal transduction histidine kinase